MSEGVGAPRPQHSPWLGVALALGLHLFQIPLAVIAAVVTCLVAPDSGGWCGLAAVGPVLVIGVSQLLYMIPATVLAYRGREPGLAKGLVIGACLTALLNAACWGGLLGVSRS